MQICTKKGVSSNNFFWEVVFLKRSRRVDLERWERQEPTPEQIEMKIINLKLFHIELKPKLNT